VTKTLEQRAQEANKKFKEEYGPILHDFGYSLHNIVSTVGTQEYENGNILPARQGRRPCIVANLSPLMDVAMRSLEDIREFTIKPEFKGFKVYVEGNDGRKKKDDTLVV